MDKRINNGGKRVGAGRKPKQEEKDLIEKTYLYLVLFLVLGFI